jgi:type IV secretory pathway VirJ component
MNDAIVMLEGPDQRAQEIECFKAEFLRYAAMPDLSQPCPVGRLVGTGGWLAATMRREAIWETVADAMSEKDDFTRRAMVYLCKQAAWDKDAKALLSDMAEHWAELRCDL